MEQLPSLDRILNIVLQEENHKTMMLMRDERHELAATVVVNHGNKRQQTVTEKGSCKHCGKFGHEKTIASSLSGIERIGAPTEKAEADDRDHGEEELMAEVERQASKRPTLQQQIAK